MDFRFGVEGSQLGSKGGESMHRFGLLRFECDEKSLLVCDGAV